MSIVLGLLAETMIHPGMGQTDGAVDLPVAREAATDYPFVAGSAVKGALKDVAEVYWSGKKDAQGKDTECQTVQDLFGKPDAAGNLLFSDAKLLLLPVRSLQGAYKWLSCPHLLERLERDLQRSQYSRVQIDPVSVKKGQYCGAAPTHQARLYLEERTFSHQEDLPENLFVTLAKLIENPKVIGRLPSQLVILHDDDFNWFAKNGLAIQAHNALDENKQSNALWYEENLPPDTLMYVLVGERGAESIDSFRKLLNVKKYFQLGGDETTGKGWFALKEVQNA
jgi:CRISPR-associated protein Cmr4